jgi:hypothetical protein
MHPRMLAAILIFVVACGDVTNPRAVQCGAQPVQVLPNGSFDADAPAWGQTPPTTALICGAPRITPFDGKLHTVALAHGLQAELGRREHGLEQLIDLADHPRRGVAG